VPGLRSPNSPMWHWRRKQIPANGSQREKCKRERQTQTWERTRTNTNTHTHTHKQEQHQPISKQPTAGLPKQRPSPPGSQSQRGS
jgi:hypothetical protein